MTGKNDENLESDAENEDLSPEALSDELESESAELLATGSDDDSEWEDADDEYEEEFSLETLSEAYANVLKQRDPDESPASGSPEAAENDEDVSGSEQPNSDRPKTVAEKLRSESTAGRSNRQKPEIDDDAACPISPASILESILFVGTPKDVKLNSRKIAAIMRDVSPKEVTALTKDLNKTYEKDSRAYRIVNENGALKMQLHPEMVIVQNHIMGRDRATRLTQQAVDVLAIVAYNQPVTREQVDKVRSRPSGSILNQMVKRDLLRLETTETKPKQKLFSTTERFLDLFGLEEIEDLPQSHDASEFDELADE